MAAQDDFIAMVSVLGATGIQQVTIAKNIGISKQTLNKTIKGRRAVKADELAALRQYFERTHATWSEIEQARSRIRAAQDAGSAKTTVAARLDTVPPQPSAPPKLTREVDLSRPIDLPDRMSMPVDVPVYGVAVGGDGGDFHLNGEVVDRVRRPPGIAKAKRAFAIYVVGVSMEPRYEEGDLVFLNPDRPARPGDDVVVELKGEDGAAGDCFIKRLVRRTPTTVVCRQYNPQMDLEYPLEQVRQVLRVVPSAELIGV